MKQIILHRIGATPTGAAETDRSFSGTTIKLGLDIHAASYVVAVQEDHATPKPARRFRPEEFVPWVETLLAKGHRVFVVYEACGFGFGLCRRLNALGAVCYVIAPRQLDEARKGVKTDDLDAGVLCQRLSRYVEGNKTNSPSSASPPRRRSSSGTSTASAKPWSAPAPNSRPRAAACS